LRFNLRYDKYVHFNPKCYILSCPSLLRPCVRRFFSEIFVFASFGNSRFSNFGNISIISESSELVPTLIFAKKSRKLGSEQVGTSLVPKIRVGTKKWHSTCLVSTHENSFRLETRLEISDKSSERRALESLHSFKLGCDTRFQCAFCCVFTDIRLFWLSQLNNSVSRI